MNHFIQELYLGLKNTFSVIERRQMQLIESLLSSQRKFVMSTPAAENAPSDSMIVTGIEQS